MDSLEHNLESSLPTQRTVRRQLADLLEEFSDKSQDLEITLIVDANKLAADDNDQLINATLLEIKSSWKPLLSLHEQISSSLQRAGAAQEAAVHNAKFKKLRKSVKVVHEQLKSMRHSLQDAPAMSSCWGLSSSSSACSAPLAASTENLKNKIVHHQMPGIVEGRIKTNPFTEDAQEGPSLDHHTLAHPIKYEYPLTPNQLERTTAWVENLHLGEGHLDSAPLDDPLAWHLKTPFLPPAPGIKPSPTSTFPVPSVFPVPGPPFHPLSVSSGASYRLDASARHFAIMELKRQSPHPFNGEPHKFPMWLRSIKHRMEGLDLSPMDIMDILEANTSGEPLKVVQLCKDTAGEAREAIVSIWTKMERRFGSPVELSSSLRQRLASFQPIRADDPHIGPRLREFSDTCQIVESSMARLPDLQVLNFAEGLKPVRSKLPTFLLNKWRSVGTTYERTYHAHPSFQVFCRFLEDRADELCNANYWSDEPTVEAQKPTLSVARVLKTGAEEAAHIPFCQYHKSKGHSILECDSFGKLGIDVRRTLAKTLGLCFKCLGPHLAKSCTHSLHCEVCQSTDHATLLHRDSYRDKGDHLVSASPTKEASTLCTNVCQKPQGGRSCSKTLLVDIFHPTSKAKPLRAYAILDEQSDQSFATSTLFHSLGVASALHTYSVTTLGGHRSVQEGRKAEHLVIQGVGENTPYLLPPLLENNFIPDTKEEVATPEMVKAHKHVERFADDFNKLDQNASVVLLIGRDAGDLLHTKAHGESAPFAHHTALGWALVGSVCPMEKPKKTSHNVCRTSATVDHDHFSSAPVFTQVPSHRDVFVREPDDELAGLSSEDKAFLRKVKTNITVNEEGSLQMPLPFRDDDPCLPNNQQAVYRRQKNTLAHLAKSPTRLKECLDNMQKSITKGHVEEVPFHELNCDEGKQWFLPVFPVIHPKKDKVRLVFDSAASYHGTSLNANLLQGPDHNNRLCGVLTRFREHPIGYVADIESMFHSFHVVSSYKDFMRFFWFRDNDPAKGLVQYRSRVHIFGNKPSPAIATIGLRHAAEQYHSMISSTLNLNKASISLTALETAREFIKHNFYVDDGLGCSDTVEESVCTLKAARQMLGKFNIRLHKIASSDPNVLQAFPLSERASDLAEIAFEDAPLQRTLGIAWDINQDCFIAKMDVKDRPFTRRGILATVNSIFDPLGMACPVTLGGKLIQRQALTPRINDDGTSTSADWDEPLPANLYSDWSKWVNSLQSLDSLKIARSFVPLEFGKP